MLRIAALTMFITAGSLAQAQQGNPGTHFIENWDLDGDGQVTLAEATERRGDVFLSFDADDNGILSPEEYDLFDEARANDMRENGFGQGRSGNGPANGMLRQFTDANGDGRVTREEFMNAVPAWFERMDRNGDSAITEEDFGPRG